MNNRINFRADTHTSKKPLFAWTCKLTDRVDPVVNLLELKSSLNTSIKQHRRVKPTTSNLFIKVYAIYYIPDSRYDQSHLYLFDFRVHLSLSRTEYRLTKSKIGLVCMML